MSETELGDEFFPIIGGTLTLQNRDHSSYLRRNDNEDNSSEEEERTTSSDKDSIDILDDYIPLEDIDMENQTVIVSDRISDLESQEERIGVILF